MAGAVGLDPTTPLKELPHNTCGGTKSMNSLPGLPMSGMVPARRAELFKFNTTRIISFVLVRAVIPVLAIRTSHSDDHSSACLRHFATPPNNKE
jgi:hypothetical protein